jgi:putative CocE/NonD family hydrolase
MVDWTHRWTLNNLKNLAAPADYERHKGVMEQHLQELDKRRWHLPLYPDPYVAGLDDWYNDFLAHPNDGSYWQQWNIALHHHEIDAPICHVGGWFDIFLNGTIKNYVGLRQGARSADARANQRLIIGPWVHGPLGTATSRQGEFDFGPDAIWSYNEMRLPWFDYWLKGSQNGVLEEPRVKLFVMGENRWRNGDEYPLPGTQITPWYFHESGRLTPSAPSGDEVADSYIYDPADPVPTLGGNTLNIPNGAFDQRPIEGRCLTYTSEPLSDDLTLIGPVICVLHAASSAPDTDWVVRLTDVAPDGTSRYLCDGILRARYRNSASEPALLTPHEMYEFVVDLWATANTFFAGHRIRVAVTSSSFPRFDRNLNTGGPFGRESSGQAATNTIFHDSVHPSHVLLPVLK